jgi:hypothetical protein
MPYHEINFVLQQLGNYRNQGSVGEIHPVVYPDVRRIKNEFEVLVEVSMSDRQPVLGTNVIQECAHPLADKIRKIGPR